MDNKPKLKFSAGGNIAMKVPPHLWDATVAFYRDIVGLEIVDTASPTAPSVSFRFGAMRLWIDRVDALSQAEVWLELTTNDAAAAARHLASEGVVRRDEIEPLPEDLNGFWIQNPAAIIHLLAEPNE